MTSRSWEAEFTEYFTGRAPGLRRTAYGLCGDWHTADDLVQATFVRLYPRWRTVRQETVDSYTYRIMINLYLSGTRRRRREILVEDVP
ncbi:MAG: sigma factor, partial [Mycobacteriales bacterium]